MPLHVISKFDFLVSTCSNEKLNYFQKVICFCYFATRHTFQHKLLHVVACDIIRGLLVAHQMPKVRLQAF